MSGSIAFCFLLYSKIDNPEAWSKFFKDVDPSKYTIYSHLKLINNETQEFIKKNAIKSIPTKWGDFSLFKASLLLFKEALKNKNNKHMVLLSGSCVPIYSFNDIYNDIMSKDTSRIHARYLGSSLNVWANSQWISLYYKDAQSLVRILDKNDIVAKKFLKFWLKATKTDGNGILSDFLGADETFPINWFLYLQTGSFFNNKTSIKLLKNIDISCTTYAYFKKGATSPENLSESLLNKTSKMSSNEIKACNNCLFARKFSNDKKTFSCKSKPNRKNSVISSKEWKQIYGGMLY